MRTRSAGRPVVKSQGRGMGGRVGRSGGRGRRPRGGNAEHIDELNGQGNDQGMGANGNVGNQENGGNPNGNVVNENVQENVGNVIVNGNRVGCSYKEFLACNPKEYDGIMSPRMRTQSAGRPIAELRGGGTGGRVGRGGGRGRGPREGNDERVDELNGQGSDQGLGANGGIEGVNRNVEGVNRGVGGAPDFSTIIAMQLQNLLPAMLAQVSNQGNVGNQNGNVVNENVQENVGNVIVNGNQIEKMESVQDMSGCSIDQKVKYTAGSSVGKALTWWNS
ncbi:hypothetical protein Tco_1173252 [Tanacetum coccineum]